MTTATDNWKPINIARPPVGAHVYYTRELVYDGMPIRWVDLEIARETVPRKAVAWMLAPNVPEPWTGEIDDDNRD